jgi:hypothetical protein
MPRRRRRVCAPVALAILCACLLSGCADGESASSPSAATVGGGLGELVREVGGEGGEAEAGGSEAAETELKELVDRETTPEEREQAREALTREQEEDEAEAEAGQEPAAEQESEAGHEAEAGGEPEGERESEAGQEAEAGGEPEAERESEGAREPGES